MACICMHVRTRACVWHASACLRGGCACICMHGHARAYIWHASACMCVGLACICMHVDARAYFWHASLHRHACALGLAYICMILIYGTVPVHGLAHQKANIDIRYRTEAPGIPDPVRTFGSKRKMLILNHFAPARTCQNHGGGVGGSHRRSNAKCLY